MKKAPKIIPMEVLIARTELLLQRVECPDEFSFEVKPGRTEAETVKVIVHLLTTDTTRDSDEHRKKITILPGDTYHVNFDIEFAPYAAPEKEFYERLLKMMAFVRVHETQEWFRVDGKLFRDPHLVGPIIDVPPIRQRGFER